MREHPWHLRTPTTEHYQWFRNLVDLHRITVAWSQETSTQSLNTTEDSHLSRRVKESLWMLDNVLDCNVEQLMDDTLPQDTLGRLEHVIWAVQARTLSSLLGNTEVLNQTSWRLGRSCVESRWKSQANPVNQELSRILLALHDSPFSGYPNHQGFLVKRAVKTEIQIELKSCPHNSNYVEVRAVADPLCNLHTQWIRGFTSALNNKIEVELIQQSHCCLQRWYLKI